MAERTAETIFDEYKKKIEDDIKSSVENFDKYLLSFSSGALGLSLALVKDIVAPHRAAWIWALYTSWAAFTGCIVVTMASYQISIKGLERALDDATDYYLNRKTESFNKPKNSPWTRAVDYFTLWASLLFIIGIIATMLFVSRNI